MFKNIVISAFGAALAAAVVVSTLQFFTTGPLIIHAEEFEGSGASDHHGSATREHGDATDTDVVVNHVHEGWAPADGLERGLYTVLANLVVAFAISLLLVGFMVLRGGTVDARSGLLWGVGGFIAVSLLPALGLPPELPGTPAADILARQGWWLATVAASAGGLALLAFAGRWPLRLLGLAFLVAPHVVGAPVPPSHDVAYPGALAGEFVVASLVVSAVLWSLSGLAAGWLHRRLSRSG
jgi:cobalt transporter subunit CbtA